MGWSFIMINREVLSEDDFEYNFILVEDSQWHNSIEAIKNVFGFGNESVFGNSDENRKEGSCYDWYNEYSKNGPFAERGRKILKSLDCPENFSLLHFMMRDDTFIIWNKNRGPRQICFINGKASIK